MDSDCFFFLKKENYGILLDPLWFRILFYVLWSGFSWSCSNIGGFRFCWWSQLWSDCKLDFFLFCLFVILLFFCLMIFQFCFLVLIWFFSMLNSWWWSCLCNYFFHLEMFWLTWEHHDDLNQIYWSMDNRWLIEKNPGFVIKWCLLLIENDWIIDW